MARKGVAASLAAVILFTALVVADSTVMVAQDDLASTAVTSQVEVRATTVADSLIWTSAFGLLVQAQQYLSSNPADCSTLPAYLASVSPQNSSSGEDGGLSYSVSAQASEAGPSSQADNLTALAQFSGADTGRLDLSAAFAVRVTGGGGSVVLSRHEAHLLNLPISPEAASSLCASAESVLGGSLSRCNWTLAGEAFDSSLAALTEQAEAQGFSLAAGWSPGSGCSAYYWFTLVETGVPGPAGSFDWSVLGSGTA